VVSIAHIERIDRLCERGGELGLYTVVYERIETVPMPRMKTQSLFDGLCVQQGDGDGRFGGEWLAADDEGGAVNTGPVYDPLEFVAHQTPDPCVPCATTASTRSISSDGRWIPNVEVDGRRARRDEKETRVLRKFAVGCDTDEECVGGRMDGP